MQVIDYKIVGIDREENEIVLAANVDNGALFWSKDPSEALNLANEAVSVNYSNKIAIDFKNKKGRFYDESIDPKSLNVVHVTSGAKTPIKFGF